MPRHMETMKDVISCDKPRVGANNLYPGVSEWDNPLGLISKYYHLNT